MIRDVDFALAVAASVADGLLDDTDVDSLAIPGHVQVLAGPGWNRQAAPDARQANRAGLDLGPTRQALKLRAAHEDGPGGTRPRGRSADLTRQGER